ncbi:Protein NRT1/ PTR family 3.1 [Vitis vinifera]|uniref:Protein NRT1/ PTR family 3.1 n=1 Tax=Vitis vinifera TaxID=29760 RepID=A0A438BXY0_VITVI|nr:Protein NRT1/ PTR family 3.1 [Vitis vinifera]
MDKNMAEDGVEENRENTKKKELGGLRTMPFILASNTLTNFSGTASFTPLIGALIADSFAGRFWTIIVGSIIYELSSFALLFYNGISVPPLNSYDDSNYPKVTTNAIRVDSQPWWIGQHHHICSAPSLRPPPCPTKENCKEASTLQLCILYISLLLTSLGTGGIRPCVVTFAADQFDIMGLATLSALTIVVYIQDNVGWGWGLGLPTIAMALSIIAFLVGSPLYKKLKPGGSPLVRLAQVIVAATKKRKAVAPADPSLLYENKELDATISVNGRLLHTNQFKWFDKAAIVTDAEATSLNPPNLWRLATVHRVEELKSIVRMLPIWAAGILHVTSSSHQHSFTIQQARTMDRHLSPSFQIPPASLSIFSVLTVLIGIVLYERFFVPLARRFTRNPSGITSLQRMGIGFMVNILATIVASFVEIKRKAIAANHNLLDKPRAIIPISVFWLVPQFALHGVAEVFMSVGHLGVSLRSITRKHEKHSSSTVLDSDSNRKLSRNLNRGRLEYYYWLVSGIQVVNLIYYVTCAWLYTHKPVEEVGDSMDKNDVDLARGRNDGNGDGDVELAKTGTVKAQ